ncbi:unnamed protein product [Amoebophrya sp. A25]|nr:unnamed protein product [Amoebophrya sp. A25]|eukprot:GSA25T00023678001.1
MELLPVTSTSATSGSLVAQERSKSSSSGSEHHEGMKMRKASRVTRNPHASEKAPADEAELSRRCRSRNEMVFELWKNAEGAPVSDYAKSGMYEVRLHQHCQREHQGDKIGDGAQQLQGGKNGAARGPVLQQNGGAGGEAPSAFPLADIRVWGPRQFQPGYNDEKVRLEFFFDGSFDYSNEELVEGFTRGLRQCLEEAIAVGIKETQREYMEEHVNGKMSIGNNNNNNNHSSSGAFEDQFDHNKSDDALSSTNKTSKSGGGSTGSSFAGFSSTESLLGEGSSTPPLNLEVEHYREAGCMIQFVVARCSVGVGAAELIGQQVFPEYFRSKCRAFQVNETAPMPLWMYPLYVLVFLFVLLLLMAWRQAFV